MKQYKDSKAQPNFAHKYLASLLIFSFFCLPAFFASAQTAEELRQKIAEQNAEIQKLEDEIKSFQAQLDTLGKDKSSLSTAIKSLDVTRKKLEAQIKVTQGKIATRNLEIQDLAGDIVEKGTDIDKNKSAVAELIRGVEYSDQRTLIEQILSGIKLSDTWNEFEEVSRIQDELKTRIADLENLKSMLEESKKRTENVRSELVGLQTDLSDQKEIVVDNASEKSRLLKQTQNSEAKYKKLLADNLKKKEALEKEMRDYESKLQFILDPKNLPSAGVLLPPLDSIRITQQFGATVDAKKLYISGTHNGVDFGIAMGTPVKSMAGGVVVGTGNTDNTCPGASFGKWILIDHQNGLVATYAHLSTIKVSAGQKVSPGEIIGYSGNTGYSTGPHLHVSVYAATAVKVQSLPSKACGGNTYTLPVSAINAYLDPLAYIRI